MNRTQKLLGSTIISLLLISFTMLPMCGVKLQRLNPAGDDMGFVEESGDEFDGDLLGNLETIDGDGQLDASLMSDSDFSEGSSASMDQADLTGDNFAQESSDSGWDDDGWGNDDWGNSDFSDSQPSSKKSSNDFADADGFEDSSSDFIMTDTGSQPDSDSWITPELMESLQKEIEDLERIASAKNRTVDSLRVLADNVDGTTSNSSIADNSNALDDSDFGSGMMDREIANADFSDSNYGYSNAVAEATGVAAYDEARNLFLSRDFGSAIAQFKNMLISSNSSDLADNCQYWIGESYFAQGEYIKAIVEFEKINAYPESNKSADAQLMLGIALMRAGENMQAEKEFSMLVNRYPDNNAAAKAQQYLSKLSRA